MARLLLLLLLLGAFAGCLDTEIPDGGLEVDEVATCVNSEELVLSWATNATSNPVGGSGFESVTLPEDTYAMQVNMSTELQVSSSFRGSVSNDEETIWRFESGGTNFPSNDPPPVRDELVNATAGNYNFNWKTEGTFVSLKIEFTALTCSLQ